MSETVETTKVETPIFTQSHFGDQPTIVETPQTIQTENTELPIGEQAANATPAVTETPIEEGTVKFDMGELGGEQPKVETPTAEQPIATSWEDAIAKVDKKEVLKKLGVNDFALELNDYIEKGGDPQDYLKAKSIDWTKVGDVDILLSDLKSEYPEATQQQLEKLLSKKYNQTDLSDDEDKELGALQLSADARKKREQKISEQQKFQIPTVSKQDVDVQSKIEEVLQKQQELQSHESQKVVEFYQNHELTKALKDSKRVAINVGAEKPFIFEITKPELITRAMTDGDFWQRITSTNPQEADVSKLIPDVAKQQKIALVAMNPNYEKDIFNYAFAQGQKSIVEEGQNAKRPIGATPSVGHDDEKAAAQRAQVGTYGG